MIDKALAKEGVPLPETNKIPDIEEDDEDQSDYSEDEDMNP